MQVFFYPIPPYTAKMFFLPLPPFCTLLCNSHTQCLLFFSPLIFLSCTCDISHNNNNNNKKSPLPFNLHRLLSLPSKLSPLPNIPPCAPLSPLSCSPEYDWPPLSERTITANMVPYPWENSEFSTMWTHVFKLKNNTCLPFRYSFPYAIASRITTLLIMVFGWRRAPFLYHSSGDKVNYHSTNNIFGNVPMHAMKPTPQVCLHVTPLNLLKVTRKLKN